jgi:aspartokinase-like uncharacterized kinase
MPLVVKVGGSLFDWPALGPKLARWLNENASAESLIVPGGGVFADQVRKLDKIHRLSEETAHWAALRAMTMSAGFLTELLDEHGYDLDFSRIETVLDCTDSWSRRDRPILDAYAFLSRDDLSAGALPHSWAVTSDSVSARLAELLDAEIVLLKSADPPSNNIREWASAGYVDPFLPTIIERAKISVRAVNLRVY